MTATIEAPAQEAVTLTFEASELAQGWLSVALAASKDKARPILARTVHVEVFLTGVRLVATDSYVLLRAWVPASIGGDPHSPALDEAPLRRIIAHDEYGRAKNLLWYLLNQARSKGEEYGGCELDLVIGDTDHDDTNASPSFDGMAKEWVTITVPDRERLKLPTIEGAYPEWRKLDVGFAPQTTEQIALSPEIVRRLADLERTTGASALLWQFGGPEQTARVVVPESTPFITGLVMPTRLTGWVDPEGDEPDVESVVDAVADAVNDGAMGPGWSAERDEDGAVTMTVDLDAEPADPPVDAS